MNKLNKDKIIEDIDIAIEHIGNIISFSAVVIKAIDDITSHIKNNKNSNTNNDD